AQEDAQKEFEQANREAEQRHTATRDEIERRHQAELERTEAQFHDAREALEEAAEPRRQRIESEVDNAEQKTRKQQNQAVWLADSVLEVSQNQVAQELKKAKEAVAAQIEFVDAVEKESAALMQK